MKTKRIFRLGLAACAAITLSSCNALDIRQDNKLSASNMWTSGTQVKGSTYGIYKDIRTTFIQDQSNMFFWGELRVGGEIW